MKKGQRVRNSEGWTGEVISYSHFLHTALVRWDSGGTQFICEDWLCPLDAKWADARIDEALGTIEDVAWLTGPRGFSRI